MADDKKGRKILLALARRARLEPEEPVTLAAIALRWVPSWTMSVMLHLLLLLLLALFINAGKIREMPPQLISAIDPPSSLGDVTSLVVSDHAGDPFTDLKSLDPPSLGLDRVEDLKLTGQPTLPTTVVFTPDFSSPAPTGAGNSKLDNRTSVSGFATGKLTTEMTTPFAGRQGLSRAKLVRREGGSVESEKAVELGLDWIVRHQRPNGSWSLNFHSECKRGDGCPAQTAMESDTAATGLALLPLLGAGHIHTVKSRHQDSIRRGLEALIRHQQGNGDLYVGGGGIAYLYSHAIASMALCEAYGLSKDPKLKKAAQKAINFIANSQSPEGGGWRYFPGQPGDTSVFGWNIFALRSGAMAGLNIPRRAIKGCKTYLDLCAADEQGTTYAYQPGRGATASMTAEGLVSRQLLGWARNYPPLIKGAGHVAVDLDQNPERNIYYWYYATQLLHNMKNEDWERWNLQVRERLISAQVRDDGCAQGSWDAFMPETDHWGRVAGRLFMTSLSVLTLEVYYRYLPLYSDEVMLDHQAGDTKPDPVPTEKPAAPADPAAKSTDKDKG